MNVKHAINVFENFCIKIMMINSINEHRLCKKNIHVSFVEQRIID